MILVLFPTVQNQELLSDETEVQTKNRTFQTKARLIDSGGERLSTIAFWLCSPFLVQWVILNKTKTRLSLDRGFV
jgi:hypothetical protein